MILEYVLAVTIVSILVRILEIILVMVLESLFRLTAAVARHLTTAATNICRLAGVVG